MRLCLAADVVAVAVLNGSRLCLAALCSPRGYGALLRRAYSEASRWVDPTQACRLERTLCDDWHCQGVTGHRTNDWRDTKGASCYGTRFDVEGDDIPW